VPFRAAIGISFLAPIFSGLSILQIIVLQLIVWSINLANQVNTMMINDFIATNPNGTISIAVNIGSVPGLSENAQDVARVAFRALTIQEYYTDVGGYTLQSGGPVYTLDVSSDNLTTKYEFAAPNINSFLNFLSGQVMANTVVVCDTANTAVCSAKNTAMATLVNQLQPVAHSYVALKHSSLGASGATLDSVNTNYHNAVRTYINTIETAILGNLDPTSEFNTQTNNFTAAATGNNGKGWLATGAYYWVLSNAAQKALSEASKLPQSKMADLNALESFVIAGGEIDEILEASEPITSTIDYLHENLETFGPEGSFLRNFLSWPADQTVEWFLSSLAGCPFGKPVYLNTY
jgi:conjugal transfer/type IV secretion protein DotA/TraY